MFYRLTIALVLTCCFNSLTAQSDQYIVKLNGDTLRGKLQINPSRDNSRAMYFKHSNGTKENIRPIRISYVYYDDEYQFRSVPFYNQRLFMQILKEDKNVSYYSYIHKRDNSIAISKVVVKPNGESIELSALTFRKQITKFLEDCPSVVVKIESKVYRYRDVEQILADYNDCTTANPQVVYESSPENDNSNSSTAAGASLAATTTTSGVKETRLSHIDEFRKQVRSLDNFDHSRDVLEWLTDVEYRVSQGKEIPNYLWSSLHAMTAENQELQNKADQLKKELTK